ncbi:MAG: DNA polymerase III subunit beta [Clostridiaceae bacterium]|jgi:DNA polymerase-3 subunit beta|nr:DNA polymerase III subunit beta [Clostridiaceae bacterium]
MKVFCSANDFSDALSKVIKALPQKKTNPVLDGVKLKAKDSLLTLSATDLELSIERTINADVKIEGEALIDGKTLYEVARKISGIELEIDATSRERVKFLYGRGEAFFAHMAVNEYPVLKEINGGISFKVNKKELKKIVQKVIFNVSEEDSRPVLKGVCLDLSKGKIVAVASNGYRLAYAKTSIDYDGEFKKVILPAKSIAEISRLIDDDDSELTVRFEKNYFMADLFHTKIVTRLIEGDYINYNKIIPTEFTTKAVCNKKDLEESVERAAQFNKSDKKNVVRLEIREKNINVRAEGEVGEINEDVQISLDGKDLNIGFNSKYLLESLKAVSEEALLMCFTTSTAGGIFKAAEGEDFLYLILPIRIVA